MTHTLLELKVVELSRTYSTIMVDIYFIVTFTVFHISTYKNFSWENFFVPTLTTVLGRSCYSPVATASHIILPGPARILGQYFQV